ncbi:MAG: 16S rRNA (cytidine(1402)-2'-O)-methyltransferase [Gammaproteobacteria bacterium]|nr:16S rRNA (cytidine(1402)-2'-O)-methyltransferase [Gammaproteobacteria bacterium]
MGTLYIVATPIGNLKDITLRALETLQNVELVAAEDTRVAKKLFSAHGISTPLISYHQHNASQRDPQLLSDLEQGKDIALITDAGTPLVSDPGHSLVALCRGQGVEVVPIPGACASITAMSVNDFNITRFSFEGFLSPKRSARISRLQQLSFCEQATILYEAKHRILDVLEDVQSTFGPQRKLMIARELTKMHEQIASGEVRQILEQLNNETIPQKGEFVVVIQGADGSAQVDIDIQNMHLLFSKVAIVMSHKDAVTLAISLSNLPKNTLYDLASEYYSDD